MITPEMRWGQFKSLPKYKEYCRLAERFVELFPSVTIDKNYVGKRYILFIHRGKSLFLPISIVKQTIEVEEDTIKLYKSK